MTERRRTADAPRVIVVDIGVDAALYSEPGNRVLVLRPGQTFNNAVAAAQRCLPNSHPDTIRTIVRTNLPGAPDFDPPEALPVRHSDPAGAEAPARRLWRRSLIPILAAALAVVVVGAFGVVRAVTGPSSGPFDDEAFVEFARRGEFVCEQIGELQATCTDPRGGVLVSEATVGPRSVVYMFSYGEKRVGLRVFADAKSARSWATKLPTVDMYPSVAAQGRFVLWGNDPEKLEYYIELLETPAPSTGAKADRADNPDDPDHNALPDENGEPVGRNDSNVLAEPSDILGEMVARAPARDVYAPSSDGLPASLGAVMMATLGVGVAEADRAAQDGLEDALPPVQVVAVKLTLGMPGSANSEPGDEGPSDDAPIDDPTETPTPTTDVEDDPTSAAEPTPSPLPTTPTPTPTQTSEPSEPSPSKPVPSKPAPEPTPTTQSSPPAESPAPEPQPTTTSTSPPPTASPEPTTASSESPESTPPSSSAPSDSAPAETRSLPSGESPIPTAPESTSSPSSSPTGTSPLGVVSGSSEPDQRRS